MCIRPANIDADFQQIRECVIELQDFERRIDTRMPSGGAIADDYIADMLRKCEEYRGKILVAEADNSIAGFVTILTSVSSGDLDDGDIEFSSIDDLIIRQQYRGTGLGRKLIEAAESFARSKKARWLRLSVLAKNVSARQLYSQLGFSELYVDFEKDLSNSQ